MCLNPHATCFLLAYFETKWPINNDSAWVRKSIKPNIYFLCFAGKLVFSRGVFALSRPIRHAVQTDLFAENTPGQRLLNHATAPFGFVYPYMAIYGM